METSLAGWADEAVVVPVTTLEGDEPGAADTWLGLVSYQLCHAEQCVKRTETFKFNQNKNLK